MIIEAVHRASPLQRGEASRERVSSALVMQILRVHQAHDHFACVTVTVVVMPPRTQNLPVTVIDRGPIALTRSSQI